MTDKRKGSSADSRLKADACRCHVEVMSWKKYANENLECAIHGIGSLSLSATCTAREAQQLRIGARNPTAKHHVSQVAM